MLDVHLASRRDFLRIAGSAAVGACAGGATAVARAGQPARQGAPGVIRFGYAAITWNGNDLQAIDDVAEVGFKGIQLRSPILDQFGGTPAALRDILQKHRLTMVALSSGNIRIDPAVQAEELARHVRNATFVKNVGGLYLQLTDDRPKRALVSADYTRLGQLLTELGKRTAELGIPVAYHNHMNDIGERPEEIAAVLDAADPKYVKLLLDVAHYQQGGGDPVKAVRQYHDRIAFLHIKDVVSPAPGATGDLSRSYQFVELGRGTVNLKGVFAALRDVKFSGWAVVELDSVPDPSRTPKECAIISREYLRKTLGFTI